MTIVEFTKLDQIEKTHLLKNMATLIDTYMDNGHLVHVYSISGFFVEATIDLATETIIEIIPYHRGFLMSKTYLINHLRQNFLSYLNVA